MSNKIISSATVTINNVTISIVANSLKYTEGKGEQSVRVASSGGGRVQLCYADNAETKFSKVMFDLLPTPANIDFLRNWKNNENNNVVSFTSHDGFSRSVTQAALVNDYEVNLSADGVIPAEFHGNATV